jgi:hypothetical protein
VAREACAIITSGFGSVRDGERLTAQMAQHCGHHKNRLWLWIMRTSTGEQPQSGHGTATNSGWSIKGFLGVLGKSNLPGGGDRAGCVTRSGVEHDVPASIGTPAPREPTEHRQCQCPGCAEARKPGKRGDDSSTEPATLILVRH